MEILKFRFGFPFWIKRAEMAMEFGDKFGIIGKPGDIISGGQGGFEPIQHSTFEIGQGIGNLDTVISKRVGPVPEVEKGRVVVVGCPIQQMDWAPGLGRRSGSFWY